MGEYNRINLLQFTIHILCKKWRSHRYKATFSRLPLNGEMNCKNPNDEFDFRVLV